MKKLSLIVGAALLCAGAVYAHDGMDMGGGANKSSVVTGEIVDLACYLGHGASGEKHAQCARDCIKNGAPMGLKAEDGNLWVLVNSHKNEKAFDAAKKLAGGKATITGDEVTKGGLNALIVEKAAKGS